MGINSIKNINFFFLNSGKKIHNKIVKFGGENFEHLGCFKNFEVEILKKKLDQCKKTRALDGWVNGWVEAKPA